MKAGNSPPDMPTSHSRKITIRNKRGLHARASAKFVTLAAKFDTEVLVSKDGMEVIGTSIMGLMMLAAARGDIVTLTGSGKYAHHALDALEELIKDKFGED